MLAHLRLGYDGQAERAVAEEMVLFLQEEAEERSLQPEGGWRPF